MDTALAAKNVSEELAKASAPEAPPPAMSDAEKQKAEHERLEALRAAQVPYDSKIHGAGLHPQSTMSGFLPQSVTELHQKVVIPLEARVKALEDFIKEHI